MNTIQNLQEAFNFTRNEAKAAYKWWKKMDERGGKLISTGWLMEYNKAWQAHMEASMALFLVECEED